MEILDKDGTVRQDIWQTLDDGEDMPVMGPVVVSLDRWNADKVTLRERNAPLGIRLRSDQGPLALAADLDRFALIVLEFPRFGDGRAYSTARILRERLGFRRELRAIGNVLRDQYLFMLRCGFDSIVLPEGKSPDGFRAARQEFSVWYQPTGDGRPTALMLRQRKTN